MEPELLQDPWVPSTQQKGPEAEGTEDLAGPRALAKGESSRTGLQKGLLRPVHLLLQAAGRGALSGGQQDLSARPPPLPQDGWAWRKGPRSQPSLLVLGGKADLGEGCPGAISVRHKGHLV